MLYLVIFLTVSASLIFTLILSPLMMALMVMVQSGLIALLLTLLTPCSWFSFMLLMVFLTGMMVTYAYVASLASNESTSTTMPHMLPYMLVSLMLCTLIMTKMMQMPSHMWDSSNPTLHIELFTPLILSKMYTPLLSLFTSILIVYLLLVLIVIVKMSNTSSAPLRTYL